MSDPKYSHIGNPETRVVEECSELIKALCKVDRFGWFNHNPNRPHETNFEQVKREMDDVVESIEKLQIKMRHMRRPEGG